MFSIIVLNLLSLNLRDMTQKDELLERLERIEKLVTSGLTNTLDVQACCMLTGFSRSYLYKLTSAKQIPHYKRGKLVFFDRAEIEGWLKAEKVKTTEEMAADADRILLRKRK